MRKLVKYIAAKTYRPLLVRYLSKTRRYSYKGISLEVPPGVFHPGFFFSTRFLLKYVEEFKFRNREVLELGCGTGLLGIYAASRGAYVTAIDINPAAITTRSSSLWRSVLKKPRFFFRRRKNYYHEILWHCRHIVLSAI